MTIQKTLSDRNAIHGDFSLNAHISQTLKDFYRACPGWANLTTVQKEALDLDALKTSRILSGGANHSDNWHDKAGYALLGEENVTVELHEAADTPPTYTLDAFSELLKQENSFTVDTLFADADALH